MSKRAPTNITLGSGKIYLAAYTGTIPVPSSICVDANLLGYIQGGATLTYTEETHEEKDDLGIVSKIVTTSETVKLKMGVLTWNGDTLHKLIDRSTVTETAGKRTAKIGGAGNAQGTNYVIVFYHHDAVDGDLWVMIVGRNSAGLTLTFASDKGSLIEPEFTAIPQDANGTLVQIDEEITGATMRTVTLTTSTGITGFETSVDGAIWTAYANPVSVVDGGNLYIKALLASGKTFTQWAPGITTNPFHILGITSNISYTPTAS